MLILFTLPLVLTEASRPAFAADPCCEIVSTDRVNGIVTARDLRTGETFQFEVDSRSLLKTMRVGQKVWKHGSQKVGILEATPCCEIVGKRNGSQGGRTVSSTANASAGATIDGKTLILKMGYEASIDPKNKGVVRVRDLGGRGVITEYTCGCDPDEPNAEGNPETCRFYNDGDRLKCQSPTCKDCDVSDTTKVGTDKAQDESSPGVSTSPATSTDSRADPDRTLVNSPVRWVFEPSPKPGRLGRVVVKLSDEAAGAFVTRVFNPGSEVDQVGGSYQGVTSNLMPGQYDVELSGARVRDVPVKQGTDTRILTGLLNVTADTIWHLFDETKKTKLNGGYSGKKLGLPVGKYYIQVGGRFAEVIIKDGQVIDF